MAEKELSNVLGGISLHQKPLRYTRNFFLREIHPSDDKEWIVTNGVGGYASLTTLGGNTRKFHALLVASLIPPTRRWVFVSNVFERLNLSDKEFCFRNHLKTFKHGVFPEFLYNIDDVFVRKTVFMPYGENTTVLRYDASTDKKTWFVFTPSINSRHFYDLTAEGTVSFPYKVFKNHVVFKPDNVNRVLTISWTTNGVYEPCERWVEVEYRVDRVRGEGWQESVFQPGNIRVEVEGDKTFYLILSTGNKNCDPWFEFEREIERRRVIVRKARLSADETLLLLAADSFIVKKGLLRTVLAGYHWFSDWGRDTLISLPGLTLVTGRFEVTKEVLLNFAKHERNGLIPNAFVDETGEAIYNTVDASLWFIDRVYQYVKHTGDLRFVERIWKHLTSIVEHYLCGTDFGIKMDDDYLISHNPGLTWMDAKVDDEFVTPRARKAVEIQALWYNALRIMDVFSKLCRKGEGYGRLAEKVKESFLSQYKQQYDVVDTKDCSCRPNKIFLASVDFSMISKSLREEIVRDVHDRLLTPYGLRSLAMGEDGYLGTYIGDYNKDLAYHNGTVWPWLLGPFTRAFLKIRNYEKKWRRYAYENFLKPILNSLNEGCIGNLGEIFDGNKPHAPRGCVAQA
ncbi:MAG TPA: glycogen debranching protein, partial [Thermoplasmata archaeon]|nr:glycogen debranching protein [Thermoplasmata archaeon]